MNNITLWFQSCYANEAHVFCSTPSSGVLAAVESFTTCIEQIECWLKGKHFKMNAEKTHTCDMARHSSAAS